MIFKLAQAAEKSWRRLKGYSLLPKVILGVKFNDGIEIVESKSQIAAADPPRHQDSAIALHTLIGGLSPLKSNSPEQHKNDNDNQDSADDADTAMSIPITVAAETAAEAAEEKNDEDDNENEAERHDSASCCSPLVKITFQL
jgi:hypothetical protein